MSVWLVDPVCRARLTTMARTRDVTRTHVLGAATVIHPSADELLRDHGSTSPVGLFMQDWLREFKQVRGSPTGPVARYHCAHHLNSDGAAAEIAWSRTRRRPVSAQPRCITSFGLPKRWLQLATVRCPSAAASGTARRATIVMATLGDVCVSLTPQDCRTLLCSAAHSRRSKPLPPCGGVPAAAGTGVT